MGSVVKFFLRFRRLPPPMLRRNLTFLHVPRAKVPTFWRAGPGEVAVVVGWSAGPLVARLPRDEAGRLRAAIEALAKGLRMSREDLVADLEAWRVFDWHADPFSRGAYSYVPTGAIEAQARLAAPIESTLFFAGEATSATAAGTVHGAIESGRRAAKEFLAATPFAR